MCKINSEILSSRSLLNPVLPPEIPFSTIWCLIVLDKGLHKRTVYVYANLRTVVVHKIQMKVCQTIDVTYLFTLKYHLFFHMMDGPLFIFPVSDHGQLAINSILLL